MTSPRKEMPSLINQDGTRNYPEFRRLVSLGASLYRGPREFWMLRSEWKDREADYQILRAQWRVRNGLPDDRKMMDPELAAIKLRDIAGIGAD